MPSTLRPPPQCLCRRGVGRGGDGRAGRSRASARASARAERHAAAALIAFGSGGFHFFFLTRRGRGARHPVERIVAVDLSPERLAVAERFGATHTLDGAGTDVAAWCQEELGGVVAIGSPKVVETLPAMLASGGAAVLVGMAPTGATGSFDLFDLADQGKRILGCNYGSSVGEIDIPKLARLYLAGRLPLDDLIGRTRPLRETAEAFDDLRSNTGVRTILTP
ncbi:zinc-binding dehydrogenase [Streptomyces sp. NPDC001698]|uniref:zinc-binding dehydrogenase n=1 Tax=Streptomyces sp. NPDC001698 TaxID=3364601 RepID=UPI0036A97765